MKLVARPSVMTSSHSVSGDVGLLADENAQRLCSIFSEAAWECLSTLKDMSRKHGATSGRYKDLFAAGLASVRTWNADVVREEVVRIQAQYPEAETVFRYVYVLLIKEVGDDAVAATGPLFPTMEEAYHLFLCRLCSAPDVCESFFSQPLLQRRVVFMDCFRNALHDVLRKRTGGRPAMSSTTSAPPPPERSSPEEADAASERSGGAAGSRQSVLREAMGAVAAAKTVVETEQEEEGPAAADEADKCVRVSKAPCFFEEGAAGAADGDEDALTACSAAKSAL